VLCLIVVPLPEGKNPFAVQIIIKIIKEKLIYFQIEGVVSYYSANIYDYTCE
jgi:hypothetical protein